MKLGELLVRKRFINGHQLKQALDAQLIYGGHLGTCLIEKGFIEEAQLGEALSEAFDLGYAPQQSFREIPRFVISTLPPTLVQKHSVVPFKLEDKTLDVAMIDPKNLQAIDELSFAAGHRARPWVAPEVRIFQAMERYYGLPRRQRYVALCRQMDEAEAAGLEVDYPLVRTYGDDHRPAESRPCPQTDAGAYVAEDPSSGNPSFRTDDVSDLLCRCENPDQLAQAVLTHSSNDVARCVLFKVISSAAYIWSARGLEAGSGNAEGPGFPIISEPVFGLLRGEAYYRGPLPDDDLYERFYSELGIAAPAEMLIVPVYMDDRLVALLYGDGGPGGTIQGETDEFRRLAKQLGLALNLILLRRQIRSA